MADKILRPITDVEIVEQMTENDTVLIERGGEIKRTKGVVGGGGGGEKYIIDKVYGDDGTVNYSWHTPVAFETVANMLNNSAMPDVSVVTLYEGEVAMIERSNAIGFFDPAKMQIGISTLQDSIVFVNDGSLHPVNMEG